MDKKHTDVHPSAWVPPNRVGLLPWVYRSFNLTNYGEQDPAAAPSCVGPPENESCEAAPKGPRQRFFPHQRVVRDLIQLESPYRGLLLFHSLGTGKSATSIAAAEGFVGRYKRVHVLVPAALEQNYREEIKRYAHVGKGVHKTWVEVSLNMETDKDAYKVLHKMLRLGADHFNTASKKAWVPYVPADFPKGNIVREVPYKDMTATERTKVDKVVQKMIDARYSFINYNGLTLEKVNRLRTEDFDGSLVIMDEAHNFVRMVANNSLIARKLYRHITEARDMKILLLSGTPIINHPYELGVMLNLVRGAMTTYEFSVLKGSKPLVVPEIEAALQEHSVWRHIDMVEVSPDMSTLRLTLMAFPYVRAKGTGQVMLERSNIRSITADRVLEQVRDALAPGFRLGKRVKEVVSSAFPPKKDDFDALFLDTTDPKKPRVQNTDLFMRRSMGLVSYLRTAGEELFPRIKSHVVKTIPLTDYSFGHYMEVRDKEIKMDDKRQKRLQRMGGVQNIMDQKDPIVYRAFSRMACNFTFPKEIKRVFPGDIRKALKREISAADDVSVDEEEVVDVAAKVQKDYEEMKRTVMQKLQSPTGSYLTMENLERTYSSKLAAIIKDIQESPGKSLVYSQFREIEGLGVLRASLLAQGWVEMDLVRTGNDYSIVDAERVLHPMYKGRRFIVFSDDRVKTTMLLHLFNGNYDRLPPAIQEQIHGMPYRNLYGEMASLMMITAAATEGISLRCVRRVLIMEPFWNMVRMDQVIGRAVRAGSHLDLPAEDRTVEVFIYMASLTEKQLKNDFTLKTKDDGLSSDQSIMAVAERKNAIIEQFLTMIRSSAIDCSIHARKNRPLENGFQCYSFPINLADDTFAYVPDISQDKAPRFLRNVEQMPARARAVMVNNRKYAAYGEPPRLYDYAAYVDAGVLIPADA
jgi:hypothetical protein